MIKRTLYSTAIMSCCDGDKIIYKPKPISFIDYEEEEKFAESLEEWKIRFGAQVEAETKNLAEDECKGMSTTPKQLCHFNFNIDRVEQIPPEIPKPTKPRYVPKYIRDMIDYLEEQKEKYKNYPAAVKIQDEIDRLKERYGID